MGVDPVMHEQSAIEPADAAPLYTNAAGGVWLSPSVLTVVPAAEAWLGIQEQHHAAVGDGGYRFETAAGALSVEDAFAGYSNAVVGILGQLGGTTAPAADNLLGSLTTHADLAGSLDGLEGIGLSAYLSASRLGATENMEFFESVVGSLGVPLTLGGGVGASTIIDAATGHLGFPSSSALQHIFDDVIGSATTGAPPAHPPGAAVGAAAHHPPTALAGAVPAEIRHLGAIVAATGAGAAEGALVGGAFGPIGSGIGSIIGGLVAFFVAVFAPDDHAREKQAEAGHGVAAGTLTVVHEHHIYHHNQPQQVGANGAVTPAPTQAHAGHTAAPPTGQCLAPRPEKCPVDEDGALSAEFHVPFWSQEAILLGSALPIGPGVEGLLNQTQDGALMLPSFPTVDPLGVLLDGGLLLELQFEEIRAVDYQATAMPGAGDAWTAIEVAVERATRGLRTPVVETQLVSALRSAGIHPDATVSTALRALRRLAT